MTFQDRFGEYAIAYGNCVVGLRRENANCSEFDSDNGPLFTELTIAAKKELSKRQLLVSALKDENQPNRQDAAFWLIEHVDSDAEMLILCKKIGENLDSRLFVTVLNYLVPNGAKQPNPENYFAACEIAMETIAKTKNWRNELVAANSTEKFGPT